MKRAAVGILMLQTRFPRPPGDIGNPASFSFPVLYETVPEASVARIAAREPDPELLAPFVTAGTRLIERGAAAISTSCGFLVLWQRELSARLGAPVLCSSLLMLPWLESCLAPGRRAGVITFDAEALGAAHLAAAGARPDTPVAGLDPRGALATAIRADSATLDLVAARADTLRAGERLVGAHPDVAAIVLECTNLGPYARDLAARVERPVFGIVSALEWLWRGLAPAPRD
jgi:hypothetical protein